MLMLSDDFYNFISNHENDDLNELAFSFSKKNPEFDLAFALLQIETRKKYKFKFPFLFSSPSTLIPTRIAAEQATNELVASFRTSLYGKHNKVLDMTAGLGIDLMSWAQQSSFVIGCEMDSFKSEILKHNISKLDISNVEIVNCDSIGFIKQNELFFDIIFIDPSRRDKNQRKVFTLQDSLPDIVSFQNLILPKCQKLIIKGSPLLDISKIIKDLPYVTSIKAISLAGECKEILIEASLKSRNKNIISCTAFDLDSQGKLKRDFTFTLINRESLNGLVDKEEQASSISYLYCKEDIKEGYFLYEPSATVMKFSPWHQISCQFKGIVKFGPFSHLFMSNNLFKGFPGRILRIEKIIEKKDRKSLDGFPANVVTRNYPIDAQNLRKKLKLKEGTDTFIYATQIGKEKILIKAKLIS